MTSEKFELELVSTGDGALDGILGGGIPARSVVVLAGEPGAGKTLLTLQTLFHAARQGEKCLYLTTVSEPAIKVLRYMQGFDFFDPALLDEQVIFADLASVVREGSERTLAALEARVETHRPTFVAIDSFRAIGELLPAAELRPFVYDLAVRMASWGATTFLVGEYRRDDFPGLPEFAVADGIIWLGSQRHELTSVRDIEVLKLRGSPYSSGRHFFEISTAGVHFFPRVSAPASQTLQPTAWSSERASTGVAGLDELLGGGLPRSSVSVIQGGTGTGKTLLCLQTLLEGARRGEKGVLFTLEETAPQLRAVARSVGFDLDAAEGKGLITLQHTSPVELSTDRFLHTVRANVESLGASRAAFDSLTTLELGVTSERRFKELVYALAKHMRGLGVTLLMTMESEQLLGSARLGGLGVSFIADNLIQLRYVELGGRLERAISVLKARGIKHDSELRAYQVGQGGLTVMADDQFKSMRGVLTGLPEREETS